MSVEEDYRRLRSPVKDFYQGKTVLLTGGSGFLGKLLIEKLVKCEVGKILLIMRPKKGTAPMERLQQLLGKEAIFVKYAKDPDAYLSKIRVIEGDVSEKGLALGNDDREYIRRSANIVIHAAADVRFDESLKESVETNVRGTQELLTIVEKCEQLTMFTYISTAFSHCTRDKIDERFYEPIIDPHMLMKALEKEKNIEEFEAVSKKFIEPWPNTYAFTKSLAEEVVRRFKDRVPVVIIRPSIVTTTKQDPIAGWTDNLYGFNGVVCGAATGALRIFHIENSYYANIVPADIVINSTLAATWYAAHHPNDENVYNCTTDDNPVRWTEAQAQLLKWKNRIPFANSLWITTYNTTRYRLVAEVLAIFYHLLPALLFDLVLKLQGRKPQIMKLYRKVHHFSDVLRFFTTNQWRFGNRRMHQVLREMSTDDQRLFPSDTKMIVWNDFLDDQIKGIRMYMMKEPWDNLEESLRIHRKRRLAHACLLTALYGGMLYLVYLALDAYGVVATVGHWFDAGPETTV